MSMIKLLRFSPFTFAASPKMIAVDSNLAVFRLSDSRLSDLEKLACTRWKVKGDMELRRTRNRRPPRRQAHRPRAEDFTSRKAAIGASSRSFVANFPPRL